MYIARIYSYVRKFFVSTRQFVVKYITFRTIVLFYTNYLTFKNLNGLLNIHAGFNRDSTFENRKVDKVVLKCLGISSRAIFKIF